MLQFRSLRSKLLLPIAVSALVLIVVVCFLVFRAIHVQQSTVATNQAFLFANTLNQATASSSLLSSARIVVNTMVRQERDIRAIGIATNVPFTVWATSVKESPEKKAIKKRMLQSLVKASKKGEFFYRAYPDGHVEMTVPLDLLTSEIAEVDAPNLLLSKWRQSVVEWVKEQPFNVLNYYIEPDHAEPVELDYQIADLQSFRGAIFLRLDFADQILSTKEMISHIAVVFFVGMFFAISFAAYLIQLFVIQPTRQITEAMDAQADGKRTVRSNIRRPDEMGKISLTFDNMMDHLYTAEKELEHHRDNLQSLVDDKTAKLAEEKQRADEANEAKSQFLATMSHELRTPMTGVVGFADILLSQDLAPENEEYVRRIKSSAQALIHVVNDILDMSKLEAGKVELEHIDFDLHELLDEIANSFGVSQNAVQFEVQLSEELPRYVKSDPNRIRQVIVNLLGNAFKFTKNGHVGLQAGLENGKIKIAVTDTGIGIAPEVIPNLFDFFVQADASISRNFEGTGLGLAISKRIVEFLGGQIGVESELNRGSCFWFELPLISAASTGQALKEKHSASDYVAVKNLNLLVAEDNKVNQLLIRKFLEKYGHTVTVAGNGREVVELQKEDTFDLIIMDVHMPEMDGLQATREIRKNDDIPIIAATADVISSHVDSYFDAGMNAYVSKPFDWSDLVLTINKVMKEDIHILNGSTS